MFLKVMHWEMHVQRRLACPSGAKIRVQPAVNHHDVMEVGPNSVISMQGIAK